MVDVVVRLSAVAIGLDEDEREYEWLRCRIE